MEPDFYKRDAEERVEKIRTRSHDFSILIIGVCLGVVGGMWANIIMSFWVGHEALLYYSLVFITGFLIYKLYSISLRDIEYIAEHNPLSKKLLENTKKYYDEKYASLNVKVKIFIFAFFFDLLLLSFPIFLWPGNLRMWQEKFSFFEEKTGFAVVNPLGIPFEEIPSFFVLKY